MGKTHSTISRRDFMKALGLGAAGVGAVTPLFADLDDMMSSGHEQTVKFKRAWYVKEREIGNPTTDTDWSAVQGHVNNYILNSTNGSRYVFSAAGVTDINGECARQQLAANEAEHPGFKTRDWAMNAGTNGRLTFLWSLDSANYSGTAGLKKYIGSPEENSHMLRAAATFFGASSVGFAVLEGDEKKICNTVHSEGRPFVWEDVAHAYDDTSKIVVPNNRTLYAIAIGEQMSKELWRHNNGKYGSGNLRQTANFDRYRRWSFVYRSMQDFLNFLGYEAFGYPNHQARGFLPAGGDGILAGLCEGGRSSNTFISPEHGMIQGYFSLVTDLPLAPTKPIDAGIRRFCKTCGKCAEACPAGAISKEKEPTYDLFDPSLYQYQNVGDDKTVRFVAPGKKNWVWDAPACWRNANVFAPRNFGCSNCMGTCTFNTNSGAGIHDFVKGTLATTSLFNGFFAKADSFYGFGLTEDDKKEEWWDKNLPVSGFDSTVTCTDGAYHHGGS